MVADRARRAHAIFTAALDTPPDRRDSTVSAACAGDAALEARVRRLLAASEKSAGFLETPAITTQPEAFRSVPDAVGNYLVLGILGVGGMATVYEAVQQNPNRRVALKVMHQCATHTDAYLRFRLEAETLARLHHPGIAQIYEAGTAQLGQPAPSPFFAMELIEGANTITEYAKRCSLTLRQRVHMFASVCDAVLHGHQNGIIHRDLKPGNVLVGADGRARVIDFGIARTMEGARGGASSLTNDSDARVLIGTLNYISPEQCDQPGNIDVRADVYSLGVVLYELTTGQLPHDLSKCSIAAAVRIIMHDAPRSAGSLCGEAAGDLNAIIAKAMEKDRTRRYVGAGAFAADIRRWLECRPIEAKPASALEIARKFARRNRPLAVAIGMLAFTLVAGAVVAGRLAYVATKARDAALQRKIELETVTEFQESLLQGIDVTAMGDNLRTLLKESLKQAASQDAGDDTAAPDWSDSDARIDRVNFTSLALRSLNESVLQRYAASIHTQFAGQPEIRARLLQQLASTMNDLGLYADAEPIIREALRIRRVALGDDHVDTLQSAHSLGSLLTTLGRFDDAIAQLRDAHARRARVLGPDHPLTLRTGISLGGAFRERGDVAEAERVWSETLKAQRRVLGEDDPETLRTLNNMGVVFAVQGAMDKAEACWRELLERRRRVFGEDSAEYRGSLGNLGVLLQDQRRFDEARPMIEQSLAADRRRFGDMHANTLISMNQLASLLCESGDLAGAERLLRECVQGRIITLGEEHPVTLRTMTSLASVLHVRGENEDAMPHARKAMQAQRRILGSDHADTVTSRRLLRQIRNALVSPSATQPHSPP